MKVQVGQLNVNTRLRNPQEKVEDKKKCLEQGKDKGTSSKGSGRSGDAVNNDSEDNRAHLIRYIERRLQKQQAMKRY